MKTTHAISGLSAAVALALSAGTVSAEDVLQTETVHVTASRVEQELMEVPMSVSVITSKDIEKSGAKTVGDLLSDIPGVEIKNDGGQGIDRVKIRGEDAFRTLVMIDGQKVAEHKSMSGAPILIDPSMIERIEVIKGPASVLYGSDAIGGAINIITKKGGTRAVQGEISAGMDTSASGKNVSAGIYGTVNGWEYRLNAATESYDNLETPIGEVPYTEFDSRSASLYLAYNINENMKVGGTIDYYKLDFMSGTQEGDYDEFFVDVPKWDRTKGALFFEMNNVNDYLARLRLDVFHQQSNKDMHNRVYTSGMYQMDGMPMAFPTSTKMDNYADNKLKQTGFSVQSDWTLGDHYLIAGYEFSYDDLDAVSDMSLAVRITSPEMSLGSTRYSSHWDAEQQQHSVYASMESPITETFKINYGARYTWVSSESTHNENGVRSGVMAGDVTGSGPSPDTPDTPYKEHDKNDSSDGHAVFNLGAVWSPTNNMSLRASWAQGYRFPIIQEMYVDSNMGGETTYANPDLKPETSDNFEVGMRWNHKVFTLDSALFYSKADDYIDTLTIADGINEYANVSEATTYGLETSLSFNVFENFEPYTTFTLLRRKFEQNGISTYDSGTPEMTARYGVRWNGVVEGLNLRADAFAISRSDSVQKNFNYDPTDADSKKDSFHLGGATTFNLTAGVSFGKDSAHSIDVGLYNITDKLYQTSDAIYEAGRYFTVKWNSKF